MTLLRRRVTELSNLCDLAQVRAVKKSCHAALVFSHGSGAMKSLYIESLTPRSCIKLQTLALDRYPQTKDGPTTRHVSKLISFERILRGGKFKSG